jgi:oligoribonuclease (3'-5' exoribonuclease)
MQVKCISLFNLTRLCHRHVKGIIDDIMKTAVKTAEVDKQKTKYLQHFINKHDTIVSN